MQTQTKRTVILATSAELMNEHYYRRLWIAVRNMEVPRREWLDELANTFRDYDGVVLYTSGQTYQVPFVDEVFGDDPDMRWLSYYLKSDPSGNRPQSRSRKLERLQILDLYFRIKHPDIAAHFGR